MRWLVTFETGDGESHSIEVYAIDKDAAADQILDTQDDVEGISSVEEIA